MMLRTPHVSLDFKRLSIPEKAVFGDKVISQLTTNVAIFKTPDVLVTTLATANKTMKDAAVTAAMGDHQKVSAMYDAEKAWDINFTTEANYVDRIANGNTNTILLSGFMPTASETKPATLPGVPVVTALTVNPLAGSIHIEVDVIAGGTLFLYIISSSNVPPKFANNQLSIVDNPQVVAILTDTHRKVDFYNLPSRATLQVSVAAVNTVGIGTPSAPIAISTL